MAYFAVTRLLSRVVLAAAIFFGGFLVAEEYQDRQGEVALSTSAEVDDAQLQGWDAIEAALERGLSQEGLAALDSLADLNAKAIKRGDLVEAARLRKEMARLD